MPVQLELSYLLEKDENEEKELFDCYWPLRIPIAGPTTFMNQADLNVQAATALLGIRVQETPSKKILHFMRLKNINGLAFPDETQANLKFKKISVRILSNLVDSHGQAVDFSIAYEINKSRYKTVDGNALPALQWLALLTRTNAGFRLLHFKQDPGDPGSGGDPCVLAGCNDPNRSPVTAFFCIAKGCG